MLTAEGTASRRERLWNALPAPCDFLIVADPSSLNYLSAYAPTPFVFRTVESSALLLLEPGRRLGQWDRPGRRIAPAGRTTCRPGGAP